MEDVGVSYLPGWSHTPCLWSKLENVLGPESLLGHLQMGLPGYPGQAICSLIQPTAHRVVNHHHIAAAPGSFFRAVRGSAKLPAFLTLPWLQSQVHQETGEPPQTSRTLSKETPPGVAEIGLQTWAEGEVPGDKVGLVAGKMGQSIPK